MIYENDEWLNKPLKDLIASEPLEIVGFDLSTEFVIELTKMQIDLNEFEEKLKENLRKDFRNLL